MARWSGLLAAVLVCSCASVRPYRFTNYTVDNQALGSLREARVAVLPFSGMEGGRVADEFSIQLGRLNRFDIVERERIKALWREQDLDTVYRFDPASAVTVGRMLGAHAVVMGVVLEFQPGRVGVTARLVSVETGQVGWQGSDVLDGRDARVRALVTDREDEARLAREPDYLAMWVCRLLAESVR